MTSSSTPPVTSTSPPGPAPRIVKDKLPGHPGVPARRRGHRRRGAVRAGEPEGGPGDQPTYQAAAGWGLGAVVAQDADPRRGLVQRPAHDRLRRHRPGVADPGRVRRPGQDLRGGRRTSAATCPASRTATSSTSPSRWVSGRPGCCEGEYVVTKDDVAEPAALRRLGGPRPGLLHPVPGAAAQRRRPAAGRRPALLGNPGGAADLPRDPAVHGAGAGRRHRRRASPSHKGIPVREVDPVDIQRGMRDQGADPGDIPSANASIDNPRRSRHDRHQHAARRRHRHRLHPGVHGP